MSSVICLGADTQMSLGRRSGFNTATGAGVEKSGRFVCPAREFPRFCHWQFPDNRLRTPGKKRIVFIQQMGIRVTMTY
jgi:hypothetical protein